MKLLIRHETTCIYDDQVRNSIQSVGMSLDLLVSPRDSLKIPGSYSVEEGDPCYEWVRAPWCGSLQRLLLELRCAPASYLS